MKPNPNSKIDRSVPQFLLTRKTSITVLRQGAGSWVKGRWVDGTEAELPIEANVQPLRGHELQNLPESERSKDSIKVYCVETLNTAEEVGKTKADIVVWEGKRWQAIRTMTYKMGVLDHTKTICYRLPETPQNMTEVE